MRDTLIKELTGAWRLFKNKYPDKEVEVPFSDSSEWTFFGNNNLTIYVMSGRNMIKDNTKHQWDVSKEPNDNGNYDVIVQHEPYFEIISLKENILEVKRYKVPQKNRSIEYYKKR